MPTPAAAHLIRARLWLLTLVPLVGCSPVNSDWQARLGSIVGARSPEVMFSISTGDEACTTSETISRLPGRLCDRGVLSPNDVRRLSELQLSFAEKGTYDLEAQDHFGALLTLHLFDQSEWDSAIESLQGLSRKKTSDAVILLDLGAAYLLRAHARSDFRDLMWSLEALELALRVQPKLWKAQFNRALILQVLCLPAVKDEWEALLEAGIPENLRDEIYIRRANAADCGGLQTSRLWDTWRASLSASRQTSITGWDISMVKGVQWELDRTLLLPWIGSVEKEESEKAQAERERLLALARFVAEQTTDRLMLDTFERLNPEPALAASLRSYLSGLNHYNDRDFTTAAAEMRAAIPALLRADSPLSLWARFYLSVSEAWDNRSLIIEELEELLSTAETAGYLRLSGHCYWMIGLIQTELNQLEDAVAQYRKATVELEASADYGAASFVRILKAEAHVALGERAAWSELGAALSQHEGIWNLGRRAALWRQASEMVAGIGANHAAVVLEREGVRIAELDGRWNVVGAALGSRARSLAKIGDVVGSMRDLEAARKHLARGTEGAGKDRLLALQNQIEAALGSARIDRAVTYLRQSRGLELLSRLLASRSKRRLRAQDVKGAYRDIQEATGILEQLEIRPDAQTARRASYLAFARSTYETAVQISVDYLDRPWLGLTWVERYRTLGLASSDRWSGELRELQARLGKTATFLATFERENVVDVWWVTREAVHHRLVEAKQLQSVVDSLRRASTNDAGPAVLIGLVDQLRQLIGPPEPVADSRVTWVLHDCRSDQIPFQAIVDGVSVRVLRIGPLESHISNKSGSGALVIGDPTNESSTAPPLEASRHEANLVAGIHRVAPVLGKKATKERFLTGLHEASVLHFAGHTSVSDGSLLLADGQVSGADLRSLDLNKLGVAVLAGCATAQPSTQGGLFSLAVEFAEAKTAWVLATLWPIRDGELTSQFAAIHRKVRQSDPHSWPYPPRLPRSVLGVEWLTHSVRSVNPGQ